MAIQYSTFFFIFIEKTRTKPRFSRAVYEIHLSGWSLLLRFLVVQIGGSYGGGGISVGENPLKEIARRLHFFLGGSNLAGAIFGLNEGNRHLSRLKTWCFLCLEFTFDLCRVFFSKLSDFELQKLSWTTYSQSCFSAPDFFLGAAYKSWAQLLFGTKFDPLKLPVWSSPAFGENGQRWGVVDDSHSGEGKLWPKCKTSLFHSCG